MFGLEPRADILHRVITWQLENRRGIARAARQRSDVARTGKVRQPEGWRHRPPWRPQGADLHSAAARPRAAPARVQCFSEQKVRALGLKMALSSKAKAGGLVVVDSLDTDGKTKGARCHPCKASWGKKVLVIDGEAVNATFAQAAGNLPA